MKKNLIIFIIIILLGSALRLWSLDKPLGLWNDEYMAWWISSFDFGTPLFTKIFYNCHMPLYYLLLKGWCTLFGNADITLRISSVVTGVLCIISMFFLGREYKDEKTGLICALFTAMSGFMIYFSQEVRPYSLIFLISVWISFFFIKSIKNQNPFNFLMYVFCNFILVCTHTIAFVYVFFNLLIFSIIILKKNPQLKRIIYSAYGIFTVLFIPLILFIYTILTRDHLSQNWGFFNLSKLFFVLTDYLTPIQLNITNSPPNLISYISAHNLFHTIFYIFIPLFIAGYFIFSAVQKKEPVLRTLGIISSLYFLTLIIAALCGKIVLSTKYSVEIYPVLILFLSFGISECVKTKKALVLSAVYFVIIGIYLLSDSNAPQKLPRTEGHKAPAILLSQAGISQDDYVISLYHQFFRYEKYTTVVPKNIINVDKGSLGTYLFGGTAGEHTIKYKGKEKLKEAFAGKNDTAITERIDNVYKAIPSGKKVAIIVPTQAAFLSSNDLKRISADENEYKKAEIMFLAFSYAKIKFINEAFKYCNFDTMNELGSWIVLTFVKK